MRRKNTTVLGQKVTRAVKGIALKPVIRGRFDESQAYLLTSSPRSGSTWVANLLNCMPASCLLFEPFQLNNVPQALEAGFDWRTYRNPRDEWVVGKKYITRVLEGRIINRWTAREMSFRSALKARRLVIKSVRLNRLLPWFCNNFQTPPPILLLRHPCAVVCSQLRAPSWNDVKAPATPPFIEGYPSFVAALQNADSAEKRLAAIWALDQLPALISSKSEQLMMVTYEEFAQAPNVVMSSISRRWNVGFDEAKVKSILSVPSAVVSKSGMCGIDGWKKHLSNEQISEILSTVRAFGLDFYNETPVPDYDMLYSDQLGAKIRSCGKA